MIAGSIGRVGSQQVAHGQAGEQGLHEQRDIRRLQALGSELPANGHVVLVLKDGGACDGVIETRPNVQVFRDAQQREGINGEVTLRRPDAPGWERRLWLDQIARVEHLDSAMASEN